MLKLVIASLMMALILLAGALIELIGRWVVQAMQRRAVRAPMSPSFEADERFGLLAEAEAPRVG